VALRSVATGNDHDAHTRATFRTRLRGRDAWTNLMKDDERFIAHLAVILQREVELPADPVDAAARYEDVVAAAAGAAVDDPMSLPPIGDDPALELASTRSRR
jgi:hypothetical protein